MSWLLKASNLRPEHEVQEFWWSISYIGFCLRILRSLWKYDLEVSLFRWKSVLRNMFVVRSSFLIPPTCPSPISRCAAPKNSTQTERSPNQIYTSTLCPIHTFRLERHLGAKWMMFCQTWSLKAVKVLMRAKPWGYFGLSTYSFR